MKEHIASAFDRDLEGIQARIMKMGGLVEQAIRDASRALETSDEELGEKVRAGDKAIDSLDEIIHEQAARVIALRAPTAIDLRVILSVMRVSDDLERIGDLAKNIAKRNSVLLQLTIIEGATAALRRMAREVEMMLKDALDSYVRRDAELARAVIIHDGEVDQMYNATFREFLTFMMEDPRNITACMHLHFIAKNVERMGDHTTSIAEQVVFLVEGEMPEDRQKADVTSVDKSLSPQAGGEPVTAHQPTVLVVEDEPAQREILTYNLEAEGFRVSRASDGDEAMLLVDEEAPDIIVLDWMLPGISGIEVCRRLKAHTKTRSVPVIMLSARSEEADKVRGLETGADDYMVKPYSVVELMARVRAQLRRTRPATVGERLEFQDIVLDAETHRVTRDDLPLKLGPTEFRLLATLMEKPGRVWSREKLLDRVWGREIFVDTRTVDVHIGRLRKALCRNGGKDPLRTVRGAGYALG